MTELTIHGRGGQGGVTLAKLIATAYFLRGRNVQAFGLYAAERSGAPIQAFVRIDDREITNHNLVRHPDHVIVLDRTLIGARIVAGLKTAGWLILNTPQAPEFFNEMFRGRHVATVDATGIAVGHGLGTRTVPIVNTTVFGAVARVFALDLADVERSLEELSFNPSNLAAARDAYERVQARQLDGTVVSVAAGTASAAVVGLLDERVGGFPTVQTGSWASRRPQRQHLTAPCTHSCPAGNDIPGFSAAMAKEDYNTALAILLQTSPLPAVCGRVCPAPCMEACNRGLLDEAINIRELERFAADHGRRPRPEPVWRDQPVAVVGSGPAGLSAAYHLARLGYPVTVHEAGAEVGGLMRTGIPAYRLPPAVLDVEVGYIVRHGVEMKTGVRIERRDLLELTSRFSAVFVATGLQERRALDLGPGSEELVRDGLDFLDRAREHREWLGGQRVVVVGGGNTAIDAARTALRLGARRVRILYRRTRAEMPAIAEEVEDALEEGVALEELVLPRRLVRSGAEVLLTCSRMRLGDPDESGRRRAVPESGEDSQFDIRCDRVILALGQSPDLSLWPEGTEISDGPNRLGLAAAPIFAGGDLATNEGSVAAAIGSGRRAAWQIHQTLSGENLFPQSEEVIAAPDTMRMHFFSTMPRENGRMLSPLQRRRSFSEVRAGLLDEPGRHQAAIEAERCLSCGVCNGCDRCRVHCPEGIVVRDGDGYRFDYDFCKGCGVCASQCPRGVIFMTEL